VKNFDDMSSRFVTTVTITDRDDRDRWTDIA